MKKLMILGASILQLPAIQQAKKMGLKVIAVDMDPNAIGFREEGVIKEVVSTIDIPAVIEAAKRHKIDGVITVASDMPIRSVAAVSKEMDLIGISDDTAMKATNKAVMRDTFKKNGVASPEFFKVSNEEEYFAAIGAFSGAFIVKPADNSGSRGIFMVENAQDANMAEQAYAYSRQYSRNGDVVVEEFMAGPEVSVEILAINGIVNVLQITDKLTSGAPHFVEIGHSQPSRLPDEIQERIKQLAVQAAKAVGILNGPAHAEIIVTKDGPKMVEIGARMGGGCITTHLVPLSTGINMSEGTIKIALGQKPDIVHQYNKGAAIRFILPRKGKIVKICGEDKAKSIPGVHTVEIQCKVGQSVGELENGSSRIGYVIAQADTPEDAVAICEEALKKIEILIE